MSTRRSVRSPSGTRRRTTAQVPWDAAGARSPRWRTGGGGVGGGADRRREVRSRSLRWAPAAARVGGGATGVIFKAVRDGAPYPEHGLTMKEWSEIPPRPVRLHHLRMHKSGPPLDPSVPRVPPVFRLIIPLLLGREEGA